MVSVMQPTVQKRLSTSWTLCLAFKEEGPRLVALIFPTYILNVIMALICGIHIKYYHLPAFIRVFSINNIQQMWEAVVIIVFIILGCEIPKVWGNTEN